MDIERVEALDNAGTSYLASTNKYGELSGDIQLFLQSLGTTMDVINVYDSNGNPSYRVTPEISDRALIETFARKYAHQDVLPYLDTIMTGLYAKNKQLTSFKVPANIKTLEQGAFADSGLREIEFMDGALVPEDSSEEDAEVFNLDCLINNNEQKLDKVILPDYVFDIERENLNLKAVHFDIFVGQDTYDSLIGSLSEGLHESLSLKEEDEEEAIPDEEIDYDDVDEIETEDEEEYVEDDELDAYLIKHLKSK